LSGKEVEVWVSQTKAFSRQAKNPIPVFLKFQPNLGNTEKNRGILNFQ
jgi:hypothetical protein